MNPSVATVSGADTRRGDRPRAARLAVRLATALAALNAGVCSLGLVLGSWGNVAACALCEAHPQHALLLKLGAVVWGSLALLAPRLPIWVLRPVVAGLSGAHFGLLLMQLAEPRFCLVCVTAGALALAAWAVLQWRQPWAWTAVVAFGGLLLAAPPLLLNLLPSVAG